MKKLSIVLLLSFLTVASYGESLSIKPDALIKNDQGEVIKRGTYAVDRKGEVLRYDIRSEKTGELLQTEIPIYDTSGEIAMTKIYDGDGDLKVIVVKTDSEYVKLDPKGKPLSDEEFEEVYRSDYKK